MKKIIGFSLVATKFSLLLCFGLMGLFLNTTDASQMPPCHQMMAEEKTEKTETADCDACTVSESTWSQPFLQEITEYTLLDFIPTTLFSWIDIVETEPKFLEEISSPDPPPDKKVLHSHLLHQKVTQLLL